MNFECLRLFSVLWILGASLGFLFLSMTCTHMLDPCLIHPGYIHLLTHGHLTHMVNSASVYLLTHSLNLNILHISHMSDKLLHIHYLFLTPLTSFIHPICFFLFFYSIYWIFSSDTEKPSTKSLGKAFYHTGPDSLIPLLPSLPSRS